MPDALNYIIEFKMKHHLISFPRRPSTAKFSEEFKNRAMNIVLFSLKILQKMYDNKKLRFCFKLGKDGKTKFGHSYRYTCITLLGLVKARESGFDVPYPLTEIADNLAINAKLESNLGNRALALWACISTSSKKSKVALDSILAYKGFAVNDEKGPVQTTELAWLVYALSETLISISSCKEGLLNKGSKGPVEKKLRESLSILLSHQNYNSGLFQFASFKDQKIRFVEKMMQWTGFFDAQVYGSMAIVKASKALSDPQGARRAEKTIMTLLRNQGKMGEWTWHYNTRCGTVIDSYPIYSVHQDGMGPMALFEVGEVLDIDFSQVIDFSLSWVFGKNEMNKSMIDTEIGIIWRSQRRRGLQKRILQLNRVAHKYRLTFLAKLLSMTREREIDFECRPYHLGWILYAFCRPGD